MQRIHTNGKTVKYVKDTRDVNKFLPQEELKSFDMEGAKRKFTYDSGVYYVETTTKEIGIYEGDICPICNGGEMQNMGGCQTCNGCGAQLKCGL